MTDTNWYLNFVCGCTYNHNLGDTYCADHTHHDGNPTADNPPAERRHLNTVDA